MPASTAPGRQARAAAAAWRAALAGVLRHPAVLLGVGQRLCGDDAIGPEVACRLAGRSRFLCLDAGPAPENFLGEVVRRRPATLLVVDAVHFRARPGAVRLFRPEELRETHLSAHGLSPRLLCELLAAATGAETYLLGVQPERLGMEEGLSPACHRALRSLCRHLVRM